MSELAFAKPIEKLEDGEVDQHIELLQKGMSFLGFISPAPWLAQLLFAVPGATYTWNKMLSWSSQNMDTRLQVSLFQQHDGCYW
jgi:hypothetical protein